MTGQRFAAFEVHELIGRGGTAEVYLARHRRLGKRVALKVFRGRQRAESGWQRFAREAQAAASVRHPHLVDVSDVDVHDGVAFLVMEYVEGITLAELLDVEATLAVVESLNILLPVLAGVQTAHDAGLVHRDLKPSNILIGWLGGTVHPKVLDFGLAGHAHLEERSDQSLIGTPRYMSPQVAMGAGWTAADDQYALGATLFRMVTGRPLHAGETPLDVLVSARAGRVPDIGELQPELPRTFQLVLARALAYDRRDRFADLRTLGRALLPFASDRARTVWEPHFTRLDAT